MTDKRRKVLEKRQKREKEYHEYVRNKKNFNS